jgi:hypothetical protein
MLAFDIETMGLDSTKCPITVAAIYDEKANINMVFRFVELYKDQVVYVGDVGDMVEEFLCYLDNADELTAFNGIQFDIPFIQKQFKVPDERVQAWVLKTYDTFEFCSKVLQRTFPLNMMLELNDFEVKSGDGMQAIKFAQKESWQELESYCADDARLTWLLSQRWKLKIPEGRPFRERTKVNYDPGNVLCLYISRDKTPWQASRFSVAYEDLS